MAERTNATVLKTVVGQLTVGSNPTPSATKFPLSMMRRGGIFFANSSPPLKSTRFREDSRVGV